MEEYILKIVARILANEASADDMLAFNDWMSRDEKNRHKFEQWTAYWNMPVVIENAETPMISIERFNRRIDTSIAKKKTLRTFAWSLAASFALLIVGTLFMYFLMKGTLAVDYYTCISQNGTYQLTLPDHTSVYLNKDSRITYSSLYGKKNRQVELQGEAYFDVTKTGNAFLLAITNTDAVIEVLGTKFNVKAYNDEPEIVATLEEGSIMFKDGKQQVLISPDQQLIYQKNTSVFSLAETETDLATAWKDNVYRYSRITMHELCNKLENIYGVEIAISPKLKDITVSGSFEYQQSIEDVLNVMKKSVVFKWSKDGNKIVINKK